MSDYDKQVFEEMVETRVSQLTDLLHPILDELNDRKDEPSVAAAAASAMRKAAADFVAMCFAPDFGSKETQAAVVQVMAEELTKRFLDSTGRVAELTAMAAMRSAFGTDFDPEMN
jgi:hypothetical protein